MKKLVSTLAALICISFLLSAQNQSKIYKTWITIGGGDEIRGTLYKTEDSSIVIANSFRRMDLRARDFALTTVDFKNIYLIEVSENKDVRKGLWQGALAGFLAGVVAGVCTGFASGDDVSEGVFDIFNFTAGQKALMDGVGFGILGAGAGAGVGAIIASSSLRITIPISGNYEKFNENKSRLKQYSYRH